MFLKATLSVPFSTMRIHLTFKACYVPLSDIRVFVSKSRVLTKMCEISNLQQIAEGGLEMHLVHINIKPS